MDGAVQGATIATKRGAEDASDATTEGDAEIAAVRRHATTDGHTDDGDVSEQHDRRQ